MSSKLAPRQAFAGRAALVVRSLDAALYLLVGLLLVEVFVESWVQNLFADRDAPTTAEALAAWPKTLKSALYLTLFAVTAAKFTVARRWRELRTPADVALLVLGVAMVVAGLVGGSGLELTGKGMFVYFRGVLVFYAWRALRPSAGRLVPLAWVIGTILVCNALVALVQMIFGQPSYQAMGWLDMTWAHIYRAQGLLDHPNHLGHALGVAMLGMLAYALCRPRVPRFWWPLFGLFAVALSATQSRESTVGFVLAALLLGALRRSWRAPLVATAVMALLFAGQLALRPENRIELQRRLAGVWSAIAMPSGEEGSDDYCVAGNERAEECENVVPQREIRLLYAQQGLRLFARSPLLGYGVGQFGGVVASREDPNWYLDPRFGPGGFDMHGSSQQQVDMFWLHLVVEVGLIGLLLYLGWMCLLVRPLLPVARHRARAPTDAPPADTQAAAWASTAVATLVFGLLVAFLSPALEDPLFPPLLFSTLGLAWVWLRPGERVDDEKMDDQIPVAQPQPTN